MIIRPTIKVSHSDVGDGLRKIRVRGLVQIDSVHVECSVDAQLGFFGSKAGDMARVMNVDDL